MMPLKILFRVITVALLVLSAGCSWWPWGGDDNAPEEIEPNPLPSFSKEVDVDVLWNRKIGNGAGDRAVKLRPAVVGGRIFAASADGNLKSLTTDTGREIWSRNVRDFFSEEELRNGFSKKLDTITGGVGAGGDLVLVGTASGHVVAVNQSDGSLAWRTASSSEVLAQPWVDSELAVVQSIDGKVTAYSALDGAPMWVYTSSEPSLTLRGTASPLILGNVVVAAFANGRIAFLDKERGLAVFDERVAVAQGTSDLERLVDIDGAMEMVDNKLYAASFQGRIVSIDMGSGRMLWAEEASSVEGLSGGFGNVYLSTSDSQIRAYSGESGREVWNVDLLLYRDISAPTTIASYIALTDFEGYMHVLAQSDGRIVGRRRVDGDGVKGGLLSEGGRLYALGDSGSLTAMEIR